MVPLKKIHQLNSLHYVARIFIGTVILEATIHYYFPAINPLWAIISLIVVTDPQIKTAWKTFIARFINTVIGCFIGIVFLYQFGLHNHLLALGISVSAIFSSWLTRLEQGWRIGPVTTALILSAGLSENSMHDALDLATQRTIAIVYGSFVALIITAILARFWMPLSATTITNTKKEAVE